MTDWQPIETAPKDGTRIDLAAKAWRSYDDQFHYSRFPNCYCSKSDSIVNTTAHWVNLDNGWRATHWMPLPPLPPLPDEATDAQAEKSADGSNP